MIAVDTETTGLDLYHGSRPFLVTICDESSNIRFWEWLVDPITRQPDIPKDDVVEIQQILDQEDEIVFQHAKFDIGMLKAIGIFVDWSKVYDTLLCSHLLDSSKPRDLTSAALIYLGINLKPYDEACKEACQKARALAKKHFPEWRVAKSGDPMLPSIKGEAWKNDLWLPRVLYRHCLRPKQGIFHDKSILSLFETWPDIPEKWEVLTSEYANSDSEATMLLFQRQKELIEKKGLWRIYQERLKVLPIAHKMEQTGVTLSHQRLEEQVTIYQEESTRSGTICTNIAKGMGFDLTLPKSGNNHSLTEFVFDYLDLPVVKSSNKTGAPSLDKTVIEHYAMILPPRSKQARFIEHLSGKRKRDTALSYMEGYKKFIVGDRLHPSLNPTGTSTLRWSSQNPNEQNISKKEGFNLRYCFGPAPGREWWSLDYDNLELRIPAYECEEPAMLELFEKPNDPPFFGSYHLLIFSLLYPEIFDKHGEAVRKTHKELYQRTKNGNFAELYGAIDTGDGKSTADKAFGYSGAQSIVSKRLRKKAQLNRYWIDYANKHGYVETLPDKTVDPDRGYPLHFKITKMGRYGSISPTMPLNYHVQGSACWVIMRAMCKVQAYLDTLQGYNMVMQVHDELDFDFPYKPNKGNLPKVRKIKHLMESCGDDIGIKLTVGINYHKDNWSEGIEV